MIKLFVFDWNGTLLADAEGVVAGSNAEMRALGLSEITLSTYRKTYEVPIINFYIRHGATEAQVKKHTKEIAHAFHSVYEPLVAHARTRAYARELLAALHNKKIQQVILSNHTVEGIYMQLERLKLSHYFDDVLANDQLNAVHFAGKADRLQDYLKTSHIKPHEAAIVGDTTEEIEIGKKFGVTTIALTGGYYDTPRLRAAKPDYLINNLKQILNLGII